MSSAPSTENPLGLEDRQDLAQQGVVAFGGRRNDAGQQGRALEIGAQGLEVGPVDRPGEADRLTAGALHVRQDTTDLGHAGLDAGIAGQMAIGEAGQADDMHRTAPGLAARRDRQRQGPAPGDQTQLAPL